MPKVRISREHSLANAQSAIKTYNRISQPAYREDQEVANIWTLGNWEALGQFLTIHVSMLQIGYFKVVYSNL